MKTPATGRVRGCYGEGIAVAQIGMRAMTVTAVFSVMPPCVVPEDNAMDSPANYRWPGMLRWVVLIEIGRLRSGQALKDAREVGVRIDAVELGRLDDRVEARRAMITAFAARKEPVLPIMR